MVLNAKVQHVTGHDVMLASGFRIPARMVIWTAGTSPHPLLHELPCRLDRGRVVVDPMLAVPGFPGVWALGDCAVVPDVRGGKPHPPTAQHALREAKTVEAVLESQMLWDPIRYDETCPSSDGACALVIADEDVAKASPNPAWIHGTVMRSEATTAAERDQVNPQASRDAAAALWKQAGITDPIAEIDAAEIYVPFSWFEPMWLESLGFAGEGEGWKLTESGATAMDGRIPVNCSGGVLSSNPIGASGMLRFGEAALQVRGAAGEQQVDGARRALGHAYGGGSQFFAMWVVGADKPA